MSSVDNWSMCWAANRGTVEKLLALRGLAPSTEEVDMLTAETMRKNAENCRALAEGVTSEPLRARYLLMTAAWDDLAKSQDWLDGRLRSSPPLQPKLETTA